MRKILVILMFMLAMGMVFAEDVQGINKEATVNGDGAYIPVTLTLNNTNAGQVVIGFSTQPVTTAADQSSYKKTSATLKPDPATGTASLSTTDIDSTYVFWQIQSSDTLYVQLSTDSLTNSGSEIEWKITDETSSSTTLIDGTDETYEVKDLYKHEPSGKFKAEFGSMKLGMTTEDYSADLASGSLPTGNYTANLVVKITSQGASE